MGPLVYHDGQRAVQDEAGTRAVADKLADWGCCWFYSSRPLRANCW